MDNCLSSSLDEGFVGEITKVAGLKVQSLRLELRPQLSSDPSLEVRRPRLVCGSGEW
jgi:hypothetical protein